VETYGARTWSAAKILIGQYRPLLVFVDLPIWRKSYTDIVNTANESDQFFNIVVAGSLPDIQLYVSAIERGAFSFVSAPFSHEELTRVVHSATRDARERRESLAQTAQASAATWPEAAP
jgi:FixJ family two-component response regulator